MKYLTEPRALSLLSETERHGTTNRLFPIRTAPPDNARVYEKTTMMQDANMNQDRTARHAQTLPLNLRSPSPRVSARIGNANKP